MARRNKSGACFVAIGEQGGHVRSQRHAGGPRQGRGIHQQVGLVFAGGMQQVTQHQSPLGIGIADFDRQPRTGPHHIGRAHRMARHTVFHAAKAQFQPHGQIAQHDQTGQSQHDGGPAHILFHPQHGGCGLDVVPAGIETHTLTRQRDQRRILRRRAALPAGFHHAGRTVGARANVKDRGKIPFQPLCANDRNLHAQRFERLRCGGSQIVRPHEVGRRIDKRTRKVNALGHLRRIVFRRVHHQSAPGRSGRRIAPETGHTVRAQTETKGNIRPVDVRRRTDPPQSRRQRIGQRTEDERIGSFPFLAQPQQSRGDAPPGVGQKLHLPVTRHKAGPGGKAGSRFAHKRGQPCTAVRADGMHHAHILSGHVLRHDQTVLNFHHVHCTSSVPHFPVGRVRPATMQRKPHVVLLAFAATWPEHIPMTGVPTGPGGPYRTAAGQGSGPHSDMRVRAVLGPTNTGKTHLAIERLLSHSSGIIGFPLRLLARENYDRMVARKGAHAVALITGEEKIVPPKARWFSCTVEAMPLDRRVEFVAVDEIQLCADPDRGHIFTDRLLHARGTAETMFLGADTIRNLIRRLVPGIEIEHRPRLSQLTHAGACKLTRLPPRSAIVAFSAGEVYAIAELLRRRRGGCAIVMGQLSPRTRNAQVALYQEKEVDYLVATDAIGMGLNMDVNHVAFASLSKFDGTRIRPLAAGEIAQVAGRAGRGLRDGTFGTTGTCPPLHEELAEAVEQHRFDPLTRLSWRNSDLDFSSPDTLLASLNRPSPRGELVAGHEASDMLALAALSANTEIRPLVRSRAATRLLWESCQIPDFRKLGDDSHIRLCGRIFTHIIQDGRIPADWLDRQITHFFQTEGTIDSLMQRLAGIRVCSYIASRTGWIANAEHWQARTREVEDRLSDILHEQLTARFVDRRATTLIRRLDEGVHDSLLSAVTAQGNVVVEGHEVGRIAGLDLIAGEHDDAEDGRLLMRAARRAVRSEIPRRVALLVQDDDAQFAFSPDGLHVMWQDMPIARLQPGPHVLSPRPQVLDNPLLDNAQRERIRNRLQTWLGQVVREHLAPLFAVQAAVASTPDLRGPVHRLCEGAGIAPLHRGERYDQDTIRRLRRLGIKVGHYSLFMPAILKEQPMRLRGWLIAISLNMPCPPLPAMSRISLAPDALPAAFMDRMGWLETGPVRIRLDIAEKIILELARMTRRAPVPLPPLLASRLGIRREMLPAVMKGMNMRVYHPRPMAADHYGPPAPVMIRFLSDTTGNKRDRVPSAEKDRAKKRNAAPGSRRRAIRPDSPFAALATLFDRP